MFIKKAIFGNNIDAKIFSIFNPDYVILEHDDFFHPTFTGDSEVVNEIMDTVIYLGKNEWNQLLLCELGLAPSTTNIPISNVTGNEQRILEKKLTDVNSGKSLPLPLFTGANKKIELCKTRDTGMKIFDIKFSELKKAIGKHQACEKMDLNYLGKVERIEDNAIVFEYDTVYFGNAISTVNAKVINKFIPNSFPDLRSIPSTLILFKLPAAYAWSPNSRHIDYVPSGSLINRVNIQGNMAVIDITGKSDKDYMGLEKIGRIILNDGKISSCFYHTLPETIMPLGRFAEFNPDHRIENTVEKALNHSLYSFWQDQKKIYKKFQDFPKTLEEKQDQTKNFIIHMIDQSTSLLNKINWKLNKPQTQLFYDDIVEEWIDMFKYWLSIGVAWEITPSDFLKMNEKKTNKVLGGDNHVI